MEKVLVVEDEEDFRALLAGLLRDGGYAVAEAPDGRSGLAAFARENPDAVVLDVQLPDIDGFEVCRRIRGGGVGAGVPILLCTVRSSVAPVAEGLKAGATDYVLKPFDPQDLLARVRAALAGAKPER